MQKDAQVAAAVDRLLELRDRQLVMAELVALRGARRAVFCGTTANIVQVAASVAGRDEIRAHAFRAWLTSSDSCTAIRSRS